MADEDLTGTAPDVDAMDDTAFAALKTEMRKEVETPQDAPDTPEAAKVPADTKKAAEPAPEGQDDAEIGDGDELNADGTRKTVPHGQYHRERERRKQAEAARAAADERFARLADRLQQLQQPAEAKQDEPAPEPAEDDIVGKVNFIFNELKAGKITQAEAAQKLEAEKQEQSFNQAVTYAEDTFRAKQPDFTQAFQFMAKDRDDELALAYPHLTPQQRQQHVLSEYRTMYQVHLERGDNPAQKLYELATRRGYKLAPAPANDPDPKAEAAKIDKREETRLAALSLGNGGGAVVNTGRVTPEQLLDMTDAEFAAYKKTHDSVASAFRAAS